MSGVEDDWKEGRYWVKGGDRVLLFRPPSYRWRIFLLLEVREGRHFGGWCDGLDGFRTIEVDCEVTVNLRTLLTGYLDSRHRVSRSFSGLPSLHWSWARRTAVSGASRFPVCPSVGRLYT